MTFPTGEKLLTYCYLAIFALEFSRVVTGFSNGRQDLRFRSRNFRDGHTAVGEILKLRQSLFLAV